MTNIMAKRRAGMEKELEYFNIDGAYGGNQDWFTNIVMHMGGCAAATACDCCIYFALRFGVEALYPYDVQNLTRDDYKRFSQKMKPYLKPRAGGVRKLSWFTEGFGRYIKDVNQARGSATEIRLKMEEFSGGRSYDEARELIRGQIDAGYPVPCLLLRHEDRETFQDYIWHWFLLTGYEEKEEDFLVKTATYGESDTFSLRKLWHTGNEEKGGLVRLEFDLQTPRYPLQYRDVKTI